MKPREQSSSTDKEMDNLSRNTIVFTYLLFGKLNVMLNQSVDLQPEFSRAVL